MSPQFRRTGTAALLAACATIGSTALAEEEASASGETPALVTASASRPSSAAAVSGLVAVIDPETGKLRLGGGFDELEIPHDPILENALSTSTEGLMVNHLPNGTIDVDFGGRFQSVAVVVRTPSGRLRIAENAVRFVAAPTVGGDAFGVEGAEEVCREPR